MSSIKQKHFLGKEDSKGKKPEVDKEVCLCLDARLRKMSR
jgi:hypothetical protein